MSKKVFTVSEAARELKLSTEGMTKRLHGIGLETKKGKTYTLFQIVQAMTSKDNDREAILKARRKKLEEEAAILELERKEMEGELAPMRVCLDVIASSMTTFRQRLMALSSEAAAKCNPPDPELARAALDEWVDRSLPVLREATNPTE